MTGIINYGKGTPNFVILSIENGGKIEEFGTSTNPVIIAAPALLIRLQNVETLLEEIRDLLDMQ